MIHYVLMLVLSPDAKDVICLKKQNRPEALHEKWTFPGGYIESTDSSPEAAASRELLEETGVTVLPGEWSLIANLGSSSAGYSVKVMLAKSKDVYKARTRTHEPVKSMRVQTALELAAANPKEFAPDFIKLLSWAQSNAALTK